MLPALLTLFAVVPQTHTADFTTGATPNGLSRRGFSSNSEDPATYDHATTDWLQQFWGGRYRLVNRPNPGVKDWVCLDLGTGLGAAELPGPLVAGGAFTAAGPAVEPDFGPYAVPFVFGTDLEDWKHFSEAAIATDSPPAEAAGLAGAKALGVTFLVSYLVSGTPHVQQITAGVWDDGSGPVLDIYLDGFVSLLPGGPQPVTTLSNGDAWTLEVRIDSTSATASIFENGMPAHAVSTGPLPVDVQSVRAAALRAMGFVTPTTTSTQPIHVLRVVLESANIPSFSGPALGSTGPQPSTRPFLVRQGDELVFDATSDPSEGARGGGRLQGTGVNCPDLLNYFAGFDATPEYGEHVLDELMAATNQRVVRFAAGDLFNKYVRPYSFPGWPNWPKLSLPLYSLFEQPSPVPHDAYFTAFDRLVDAATARGIYLVPVLVWNAGNPLGHKGDPLGIPIDCHMSASSVRSVYDIGGNPPTGSPEEAAQDFVEEFVTAVVARYAEHPTILMWEVGNEWDNNCVRGLQAFPPPSAFGACGQPNPWPWVEWWEQPEQCAQAQDFVAALIGNASVPCGNSGRRHPISSGHAEAASRFDDESLPGLQQTIAKFQSTLPRFYGSCIDVVSAHLYPVVGGGCPGGGPCADWLPAPFTGWTGFMQELRELSRSMDRPTMLGETNFHADHAYDAAAWQTALDAYSGLDTSGATPRVSLVLSWAWMKVPDLAYDDPFDVRPEDVGQINPLETANRAHKFEAFAKDTSGAPRILMSGWGTTFAQTGQPLNAQVRAHVADFQNDVAAVNLLDAAGSTAMQLTHAGGSLWTGSYDPFVPATSGTLFHEIVAIDAEGHASLRSPRVTFAPPVPGPGPLPTGSNVPNAGQKTRIPYVRAAGPWGFDPLSNEGGRLRLVAEICDSNGVPLSPLSSPPMLVFARWNVTGASPWTDPWNNLGAFHDDGAGGDLVANDGLWTMDLQTSGLASLPSQELLLEVLPVRLSNPPGMPFVGDIWPRLVVH